MNVIWKSIPFGLATALSLALVLWFAGFVAERSGSIAWAFLFVGLAGALALILYLVLRWLGSLWVERSLSSLAETGSDLQARLSRLGAAPVSGDDLKVAVADLRKLAPDALRLATLPLVAMMFMGVMVEITTLANAAIMYLQAKRLEEQNLLFSEQNAKLDYEFLREWAKVQEALRTDLDNALNFGPQIDSEVLSNLSIVPQFHTESTGIAMDEGFVAALCPPSQETCGPMPLQDLLDMTLAGAIIATADNAASLRGFWRLMKSTEQIGIVLFVDGSDDIRASIDRIGAIYSEASLSCKSSAALEAKSLWDGLSGTGYAALQAWGGTEADIVPGYRHDLKSISERASFLGMAAGLGIIGQTLGATDHPSSLTAEQASALISKGLVQLQTLTEELKAPCDASARSTIGAFEAMEAHRDEILRRITAQASPSQ